MEEAKSMTVLFLPSADSDFEQIHDFIAEDNPDKAKEFIASLKKTCFALGENPHMGRLRPEIRADLRGFSVSPYIILYQMTDDAIEIVNIIHGSRDIEALF